MRLAASAVVLALLMAQPAAARQPIEPAPSQEASAPMSVERKAGCGMALVAIQKGFARYPGALSRMPADRRKLVALMIQGLGAQGQVMLDEAFAEGAMKGMSPAQVYAAGTDEVLAMFEGMRPSRAAGEAVLQRFSTRCAVGLPPGLT